MYTGYEQVRSVVAAIAGDLEAADRVELVLPETGVCSTDIGSSCDALANRPGFVDLAAANVPDEAGAPGVADVACAPDAADSVDVAGVPDAGGCCGPADPVVIGIPTGTEHGRSGESGNG